MKRSRSCFWAGIFASILLVLLGGVLWSKGHALPVYTDSNAPFRLSLELQELPRDHRFQEWYRRLSTYETPHKRLVDGGRGLIAAGIGLFLVLRMSLSLARLAPHQRWRWFMGYWFFLWVVRVPLIVTYYNLREERFDYPTWGDSVMIPIMSEVIACVFGSVITIGLVWLAMRKRVWPSTLRWSKPEDWKGWFRLVMLLFWLGVLVMDVAAGIPDGHEGTVISELAAMALLWRVMWAEKAAVSNQTPEACEICPKEGLAISE